MSTIYLLLGSNMGQARKNLQNACVAIGKEVASIKQYSSLYQTAAWGVTEQEDFINQAIILETDIPPLELLHRLKAIEQQMGRSNAVKWGPRVIDIDILFYGNEIVQTPELVVPHKYIAERRFTLEPLNEIAPEFTHPLLNKTIAELLKTCTDSSPVTKLQL